MRNLLLLLLASTLLVGCYTQNELDEHKFTYERLAQEAQDRADAAIAEANAVIQELSASLSNANNSIAELEVVVSEANAEIDILNDVNEGLVVNNNTLNATIVSLEDVIENANERISELEAENKALKAALLEAQDRVQYLIDNPTIITVTEVETIVDTVIEYVNVGVPYEVHTGISQEDYDLVLAQLADFADAFRNTVLYTRELNDKIAELEGIIAELQG